MTIAKSPNDQRDYDLRKFGLVGAGELVEALHPPTTIRNQGSFNTCFAFALASVIEQAVLDETGRRVLFSPGYIYANKGMDGEGTYPRDCLQIIRKKGAVGNEDFNEQGDYWYLNDKWYQNKAWLDYKARLNRLDSFGRLYTAKEVITAVQTPRTYCLMALSLTNGSWVDGNGVWHLDGIITDAHMVRLLGVKQIAGEWCYKIQNSWGEWGQGGCAYVPISTDKIMEMWFVTDRPTVDVLKLTVGQTAYSKNNVVKVADVAPTVVNGRTLVPVRLISEEFGADVQYDDKTKLITITL